MLGRTLDDPFLLRLGQQLAQLDELMLPSPDRPSVYTFAQRFGSGDRHAGTAWVVYSLASFEEAAAKDAMTVREQARRKIWSAGAIGLAIMALGAGVSVLQAYRITGPLRRITAAAREIAGGSLDHRLIVRGDDEVAHLGRSFNEMSERLAAYLDAMKVKVAMDRELELARQIQRRLLPEPGEWRNGGMVVAGSVVTAERCGGDWWLRRAVDPDRTLIVVADVTGHDLAAALVMATAIATCESALTSLGDRVDAEAILCALNRGVFLAGGGDMAMTCLVSLIDTRRRVAQLANAGHVFPFVVRGQGASRRCTPVVARGPQLGDQREPRFPVREIELAEEDLLVWLTDGLVECANGAEPFGVKRFCETLRRIDARSPRSVLDQILEAVRDFRGHGLLEDDATLVIGRISA
jgi:sigma-B regulation protein RsbU (phosphoserine phosphatase)